jgi:hypothetical protein
VYFVQLIIAFGVLTVFAFIVKRFRVFRAPLQPSYDLDGKINYYITRTFKNDVDKHQTYKLPNADKRRLFSMKKI